MATTFLVDTLGAGARLQVQVAWGADVTAAEGTWTWTDITADVLGRDRINITLGRSDEASASQPAHLVLTLDNRAGAYSLGPQSSNYPNVRRGTPIRVRIDPSASGASYSVVMQGYADGWTPSWDATGNQAEVRLDASGILRRLAQGDEPVLSAIRRALTSSASVVAYWPCEDGKTATAFAPATGTLSMTWTGTPDLASASDFPCSAPLPKLRGSVWVGNVNSYTDTGELQFRCLARFPSSGSIDGALIMRVITTGTARGWDLRYRTGGLMSLEIDDTAGALISDTGPVAFTLDSGVPQRIALQMTQVGADISWQFSTLDTPNAPAAMTWSGTTVGRTLGTVLGVAINSDTSLDDVTIGHISVQNDVTSLYDNRAELDANLGETVADRITRLCAENDVPVTITGTATTPMGPQSVDTLLNLLRQCEAVDQGILHDGLSAGLSYVARSTRENAAVALTLDATLGQVKQPLDPVDDDQRSRNQVTASRVNGSSFTYADTTGPLGTTAIGLYDASVAVNSETDQAAYVYAGWLVHLGTIEGYRYPRVPINLAASPELAAGWLAIRPAGRIDLAGVDTYRSQFPTEDPALVLEGYSQQIDQHTWDVQANCSPQQGWRVGLLADATGSTGENLVRLASDGSTIDTAAAIGATSLSVATASGPLWTRVADDFPFDIDVAGIRVTVTGITGATSPQTFTVTGATVTKALAIGDAVAPWRPPALAL